MYQFRGSDGQWVESFATDEGTAIRFANDNGRDYRRLDLQKGKVEWEYAPRRGTEL